MSIDAEHLQLLRTLVDACKETHCADEDDFGRRLGDLYDELTPETASCLLDEIARLRKALEECSDSLHSEMLGKFGGQLPDDMHPVNRREYDRDMAEVAEYRATLNTQEAQ